MADEQETLKKAGIPEKSSGDPYESLAAQIQAEHELAWKHQKPKKDEAEVRLRLYNNQKRKKKDVGDTTLFTVHQTILASLYIDRLTTEWGGREEGDEEVAENLNAMSEYDYDEMGKDEIDYDWIWDTLFFGRGLVMLSEYERDPENNIFVPVPEVLDPITFLHDPRAASINGNRRGKGACRFFGREIKMTAQDIEELPHRTDSFKMTDLKFPSGVNTRSLLQDAIEARDMAQGRQTQKMEGETKLGVNAEYDIVEWHTHQKINDRVKKVKVWLANERKTTIGYQILETEMTDKQKKKFDEDQKEAKEKGETPKNPIKLWPVIDRPLYPTAHDWDGTSIPDLTEDKQRARAVAQNLGLDAMKADLYPMYIYDSNKVINRNDLNFNFNKFIPIDAKDQNVTNAVAPLIKNRPNLQLLDFIYNSLDISAQKATATPELQQGQVSEEKRTLGEINIIASKVDTRYSLSAKVFGWSEKRFWLQWYRLYKSNFESDIDEKVIRLVGAFGAKHRPLRRSNIVANIDPDVKIESRVVSRARQLEERQALTAYFGLALQEPTSNRRWGLKKLAKLNGLEKDEVERLFPPTIDERIAERENDSLNNDITVPISVEDDHNVHLEMHSKAGDTPATYAHITTHEEALSIKKVQPELFPQDTGSAEFQPPGTEKLATPNVPQARPIAPSQAPGAPTQ